jgi:hypothetical protein
VGIQEWGVAEGIWAREGQGDGSGEDYVTGRWMMCTAHQYYLDDGTGHVAYMGREEVHTRFWWGNLRGRDDLEDPGIDGRITLTL